MRISMDLDLQPELSSAQAMAEQLDGWLRQWHSWCQTHVYSTGFYSVNPACRQARASRQYDYENGAIDAHVDAVEMEAVDAIISAIDDPWRTALMIQARNLWSGVSVWRSPRLPADEAERAVLLIEARNKLLRGLLRSGIF